MILDTQNYGAVGRNTRNSGPMNLRNQNYEVTSPDTKNFVATSFLLGTVTLSPLTWDRTEREMPVTVTSSIRVEPVTAWFQRVHPRRFLALGVSSFADRSVRL